MQRFIILMPLDLARSLDYSYGNCSMIQVFMCSVVHHRAKQ